MGSHKKSATTFCGKPLCVGDVQCPKGVMTEAQKGLRERNMSLYSVRNYLLGFRQISGVNILVQKKRISAVQRKIGIPETRTLLTPPVYTMIIICKYL